jgi:ubiquinone/menaquinone biosynthesis C-methylase UbiE
MYLFQAQLVEIIHERLAELDRATILEVGFGKGNEIVQLAKAGALCFGLDFSESAILLLKERARREHLDIEVVGGDARRLPFQSNSFDLVFSQGVLEHFTAPNVVLQEQLRVLKKGGVLVVEVPNKWTLYTIYKKILMSIGRWPPGWETQYSPRELESLLEQNGFHVIDRVGWDFLFWKVIRKVRKKIGIRDKKESEFVRALRQRLEHNPFLLNLFLSITLVARKK